MRKWLLLSIEHKYFYYKDMETYGEMRESAYGLP